METKIQLVRCPIDDPSITADQWNMPLDLLVVADAIDKRCEVEIIDGTFIGLDRVRQLLDPQSTCIGFTYTALSSKSLGILSSEAKSNGAIVIVGGQAATGAADLLIREKSIDAVCVGDGEPTMSDLSRQLLKSKVNLDTVPNLLIRDGDEIVRTHEESVDVWNQHFPSRTLGGLNPEKYLVQYPATNTLINMAGTRAINLFSKRGCTRRCSFCARQDKALRLRNPWIIAKEIHYLAKLYNVDYILDTSDTWVAHGWGQTFAQARVENNIDGIEMMVFADARDITPEICRVMQSCGIKSVLLGIESGSKRVLFRNGKAIKSRTIIDAVDHLVNVGIRVSASFVLGLLDENEDSLCETIDLTATLHQRPGVLCYGNVIMPLKGSWLWQEAFPSTKSWPSFITQPFDYDLPKVRELYVSVATRLPNGVKQLENACEEILTSSHLPMMEYAR